MHDCAQQAQVYRLLESLIMQFTQSPHAGLLQQPARVAGSIPGMSYSSGNQASSTGRNEEPNKPGQVLQHLGSTERFENWFLHWFLPLSSSTFLSACNCFVFLFSSPDFYGDSRFPRNRGGRGIRRRESGRMAFS